MSETEVAFRAALHESRHSTAAVLLSQLVAGYYLQHRQLSLAQDAQLQRTCLDLLTHHPSLGAADLIQAAVEKAE
ncbi:hypothetical protein GCM10027346_43180 [Hymenobacter seoulensis]